ncbi:MAG: hypothetical protein JWQ07_510, partial [Ramlibacter sp.]|nr:hypothetical protein [Ramlibacter sp.]
MNKPSQIPMGTLPTRVATRPVASPAVAGFRPAGVALAVAAAFMGAGQALGQPSVAQVIQGQASFAQQGNGLLVTTQNAAGTNRSAINWQSFSIPAGSVTRFDQPSAASLSINRVVGNNPSAIFGTLSSNGKLVLVNPSGIAVGAGAVVDTAGFTASTLRMSDADALAGRLVFGGDGLPGGTLSVDGRILARSGDVVLIAPNVQAGSQALLQAPNGSTILAAGQKVELTGRGLEGIRLELQAPSDQAVNLGTLQGDAVGIFAGQLKHSGLVQATGISSEGGKVVLKALDSAEVSGRVAATSGQRGGQVQVTANKVMLKSGALIDVSGREGGGEALVGGGWQGKDSRVANAQQTVVEAGATINADAKDNGNGGTVVVWADDSTSFRGNISARGGEQSGDGGQAETSGKKFLEFAGRADLRAAQGQAGGLLLDPNDISIQLTGSTNLSLGGTTYSPGSSPSILLTGDLNAQLALSNVIITSASGNTEAGKITVADPVSWGNSNQLTLRADGGIAINAAVTSTSKTGTLNLRAFGGDIAQGPSGNIQAQTLFAYADAGAVTLNNTGNNIGGPSGSAGYLGGGALGGAFSFVNSGGFNVSQTTPSPFPVFNGVVTSNQAINLTALTGDLVIIDTVKGVDAGSGAVTLTASTGSITQYSTAAAIKAGDLTANAANAIVLTATGGNAVTGTFNATQTSTSPTAIISFVNAGSPWSAGAVTSAASNSAVTLLSNDSSPITVTGQVKAGPSSSITITSAGGGALLQGGGVLIADSIALQQYSTGAIGTSGTPLQTQSRPPAPTSPPAPSPSPTPAPAPAPTTSFTIGGPSGPSAVYIAHSGVANLNSISLGANAPFAFSATGNLNVNSNINTGTASLTLGSGGLLTLGNTYGLQSGNITLLADSLNLQGPVKGGSISLTADNMSLQGAADSIDGGAGLIAVQAVTPGRDIELGSNGVLTPGTALQLGTTEMASFKTTGTLRIGSLTGGEIYIGDPISPNVGVLSLKAGGDISQYNPGTITVGKLAIATLGNVTLDTPGANNMITDLAAELGDASNVNRNFKFSNSQALNIASGLDGISGVSITLPTPPAPAYDPLSPDGVIALTANNGALTQAPGALLAGKAVYAEGSKVELTELNVTGVIAGKATGSSQSDVFRYTSTNGINVNKVYGFSGIRSAAVASPPPSGSPAPSGPPAAFAAIELIGANITQAPNAPIVANGGLSLSTSGRVDLTSITNAVAALATQPLGASILSPTVPLNFTNSTSLQLGIGSIGVWAPGPVTIGTVAGDINVVQPVSGNGVSLSANGGALTVAAGFPGSGVNLLYGQSGVVFAGAVTLTGSTTIDSPGDVTVNGQLDWSGGSLGAGTGQFIVSSTGGAILSGPLVLSRPMVNNGEFDLVDTAAITGAGSIANAGTFRKGFTSIDSLVDAGTFSNTGTIEVQTGRLQFGAGKFTSNSGTILLGQSNSVLDNSNTSLNSTSSGVIAGIGTLRLGSGTLENFGAISPGGADTTGELTIDAALVHMNRNSQLNIDIAATSDYDVLVVTGDANFANNVGVQATILDKTQAHAATIVVGDTFDIVRSSTTLGVVGGAVPNMTGFNVTFVTDTVPVMRATAGVAPPPPPPPPTPAPTP